MLKRYERFLKEFDKKLKGYFEAQSEYICCKEGCSECCEIGDYPFSELEMMYLMSGFKTLKPSEQIIVRQSIASIKKNRVTTHLYYKCPFLINKRCCLYKYRGITCRTYGLAYVSDNNIVKVPECVYKNLCYSTVFRDNELFTEPIKENLSLLNIINGKDSAKFKLRFGVSRSLIDWF